MEGIIDIVGKMSRTQYKALVRFAVNRSTYLSLVVRDQTHLNSQANEILKKLEPYLLRKTKANSWPGTKLYNSSATVFYYRSEIGIIDTLLIPKTLFHWQHPDFPEDLSFYNKENQNWFCSIAHEHAAYFEGEFISKKEVLAQVPGLRLIKSISSGA